MTSSVALDRALLRLGTDRVWGGALGDLRVVEVPAASGDERDRLVRLLTDADGVLGPGPGVGVLADGTVRISSRPGARCRPVGVDHPSVAAIMSPPCWGAVEIRPDDVASLVSFAPGTPPRSWWDEAGVAALTEAAATDGGSVLVVAGPGVGRHPGGIDALRRLAAECGAGVVNTWGLKGLFDWQSPHHLGTAGLQADDFVLAGVDDAAVVIGVGTDPCEVPRYRWAPSRPERCRTVEVGDLDDLRRRWPFARHDPGSLVRPRLYTELAAALAPDYAGEVASSPATAVMAVRQTMAPDDLVVADPGPAGLWVARAFPTTAPHTVFVPAVGSPGLAAAMAWAAAERGRRAVAVTHQSGPVQATTTVMRSATEAGWSLELEWWGAARDESPPGGVGTLRSCDFGRTAALVDVAGPVVAWQ